MNLRGRQQKIDDLFVASVGLPLDERTDFLVAQCQDDVELRQHVEALLAADAQLTARRSDFLCPANWNLDTWCTGMFDEHHDQVIESSTEQAAPSTIVRPDDSESTIVQPFMPWPREADTSEHERRKPRSESNEKTASDSQPQLIPGFEIIEEIGRGGMGVVYRAMDLAKKEVVALKTMRHADSVMLAQFKKEFRGLTDVVHPNLARLYKLSVNESTPYFTMEFVPGRDFRSYVRDGLPSNQPMSLPQWQRLLDAFHQLAEGLCALHVAGKVHRDIKPANILVTPAGHVVVVDFGLAIDLRSDGTYQSVHRHISGTPAFMSPEQSIGDAVTPASDWYSVGVVIYEAITGRLPFHAGPSRLEEQAAGAPPFDVPDLPDDIATLCIELLHYDPERRPTGDEVLSRIGKPMRPVLPPKSAFIGREEQLQQLWDGFQTLRRRQSSAVLLHGQSGSGKSALLAEFLDAVSREPDVLVLSGRCYKQETVPYKAVDELLDSLSRTLSSMTHAQADACLPRDIGALAKVFPTLHQVDAVRRAPPRESTRCDQQELRRRAFGALRELLTRLGDRKRLVLVIDDLQWGDADSTALLNVALRQPDGPTVLFVGSFRSKDIESSDSLRSLVTSLDHAQQVTLDSLSQAQSHRLAISLLGQWGSETVRDDVATRIAAESMGHPFFLRELARGAIHADRSQATTGLTLEELLWTRIEQLPRETRSLLCTVAIAGQPLQEAYASAASQLGTARISSTLKTLRDEHLIRDCGMEDDVQIDTYHDRVREIIFARLDVDSQKACHKRLAETGETLPQPDVKSLALHFRLAGERQKSAIYYVQAADEAAETLAFNQAANFYAEALQLHDFSNTARLALRAKMADALSSDCRNLEAAQEYLELADMEGANRLEMLRRAFSEYLSTGRIDDGMSILRTALKQIGQSLPRTPIRAVIELLVARFRLAIRGLKPTIRDPATIPPEELLRVDVLWSVAICLTTIDHIRGATFVAKCCLDAMQVGEPSRIARGLALESGHLAGAGRIMSGRSEKYIRVAAEVAKTVDDPLLDTRIMLCDGIRSGLLGGWESCYSRCRNAELGFQSNEVGETTTARFWQMISLHWLGRFKELQEQCPTLVRHARERGDLYEHTNLGTLTLSSVRLAQDRPRDAWDEVNVAMRDWNCDGFHIQNHLDIVAKASILLYEQRLVEAERELSRFWSKYRSSFLSVVHLVRVDLQHLRARIAIHAIGTETPYGNPTRVARKALRSLKRQKLPWSTALATAGEGSLAAKLGDTERARTLLTTAASSFSSLGMELYAAASRRHLGRLESGPSGRAKIEEADQWMIQEQLISSPAKLADHLVPGSGAAVGPPRQYRI